MAPRGRPAASRRGLPLTGRALLCGRARATARTSGQYMPAPTAARTLRRFAPFLLAPVGWLATAPLRFVAVASGGPFGARLVTFEITMRKTAEPSAVPWGTWPNKTLEPNRNPPAFGPRKTSAFRLPVRAVWLSFFR